jgi:hypothetical protein
VCSEKYRTGREKINLFSTIDDSLGFYFVKESDWREYNFMLKLFLMIQIVDLGYLFLRLASFAGF